VLNVDAPYSLVHIRRQGGKTYALARLLNKGIVWTISRRTLLKIKINTRVRISMLPAYIQERNKEGIINRRQEAADTDFGSRNQQKATGRGEIS